MEINNVNDLSKIMQPVLVGLVDQLANRVYEPLNFFLQSYYDSYNPVSYRRQYDFLRSAIKVKGRMSRGKAVAYVYIDTEPITIKATKRYDIRQKDFFMDDEHKKIRIKPSRNLDKTMKAKK